MVNTNYQTVVQTREVALYLYNTWGGSDGIVKINNAKLIPDVQHSVSINCKISIHIIRGVHTCVPGIQKGRQGGRNFHFIVSGNRVATDTADDVVGQLENLPIDPLLINRSIITKTI